MQTHVIYLWAIQEKLPINIEVQKKSRRSDHERLEIKYTHMVSTINIVMCIYKVYCLE